MKNGIKKVLCAFILIAVLGCMNKKMTFKLNSQQELKGVASASGMSAVGEELYVVGDDSPFLFRLNKEFEMIQKIPLLPGQETSDSIFAKNVKPDLEAMALTEEGRTLLIFGSGSKSPQRDILIEVQLQEPPVLNSWSLTEFYRQLKSVSGLLESELNIEAAEIIGKDLLLFNRGKNLILKYNLKGVFSSLKKKRAIPVPEIYNFQLPKINGIEAGFSGATLHPDGETIIFTATVEDTGNWIDDGEVLGSFLGIISKNDLLKEKVTNSLQISSGEKKLLIKVESLAVLSHYENGELELALVTDSDGSASEILTGILKWN